MANVLPPDEQIYAVKTWRYLRLAMIVLIVGLLVSIAYERANAPGCFQSSISAYYYTPVHGFLVGMLVAVGACLICLKGNNEGEDALLTLAGMFAPVVALVPTPNAGDCFSIAGPAENRDANVSNNVFALLVAGGVGLVILAVLVLLARAGKGVNMPSASVLVVFAVTSVVWLLALVVFNVEHRFFIQNAHYTAAIAMFACFLAVVIWNAVDYKAAKGVSWLKNHYALIAAGMVIAAVVIGLSGLLGFDYWVLVIEATLITFFAVFWAIQTGELWDRGIRKPPMRQAKLTGDTPLVDQSR